MIVIHHRINTSAQLQEVNRNHGIEIDLRSNVNQAQSLHLSHDPWCLGENFHHFLQTFHKLEIEGPIVLNTKEDGLESLILEKMHEFNLKKFLFLDTTLPTLHRFFKQFPHLQQNFLIRYSTAEEIPHFVDKNHPFWVWFDCFLGVYPNIQLLKKKFPLAKICLVSPELQKQPQEKLSDELLRLSDAICTKQGNTIHERF